MKERDRRPGEGAQTGSSGGDIRGPTRGDFSAEPKTGFTDWGNPEDGQTGGRPAEVEDAPDDEAPSEELITGIAILVDEDSLTEDLLLREIRKTAALRQGVGACGGISKVLAFMVAAGRITETDGVFSHA